jgi:hypothetical protein
MGRVGVKSPATDAKIALGRMLFFADRVREGW